MKMSIFLTSFFSMNFKGSKPFTSLAMRTGKAVVSNRSIGPIQLRPATRFAHTSSFVLPEPQIRPMPVTTTRRSKGPYLQREKQLRELLGVLLLYVFDCIADTGDLLCSFVGYFDIELFFESHHQFHRV